jgi:hypothetical protein
MDPINYILDVKNPIEEAIKGYTMGRNDIAQRQELQIQQQNATMAQKAFEDQQTALEEQRAAAAQQKADAAAFQQDLMIARDAIANKTWTAEDASALKLKYANTLDEVTAVVAAMDEPKLAATRNYNISVVVPALMGDTETALKNVDERIAAAEASGDLAEVKAQKAFRQAIVSDTYGAGLGLTLTSNASGLFSDELMKNILDKTQTGQKPTEAMRTMDAQLRAGGIVPKAEGGDGQYEAAMAKAGGVTPTDTKEPESITALRIRAKEAGLVAGTPEYNQFMINGGKATDQMGFKVNPDGSVEFSQGAGAGSSKASPGYVTVPTESGTEQRVVTGSPAAQEVAKTAAQLDSSLAQADKLIGLVETVRDNPELDAVTGFIEGQSSIGRPSFSPETMQNRRDLVVKIDQLKGNVFLQAYESLKGSGQITEIEGTKAEAAIARMDRTQGTPAFKGALNEFVDVIKAAKQRMVAQKSGLPKETVSSDQSLSAEDMQYLGVNP